VDDIIIKVNDQPVRKIEELDAALRILSIGQFVNLDVVRQELPIRIHMQVEDGYQNQ
jgi:S1-C subfamily serine protease